MRSLVLYLLVFLSPNLLFSQVTFYKTFSTTGYDYGMNVKQTRNGNYLVYGISDKESDSAGFLMETNGKGDSLWVKRYPGFQFNTGFINNKEILTTPDGGFTLLSVNNLDFPSSSVDDTTSLIKTDSNGNIVWIVSYPGVINATYKKTHDNGFIICGQDTNSRVIAIKTDSLGQVLWRKPISIVTYGIYGGWIDYLSVIEMPDGKFLFSEQEHHINIIEVSRPLLVCFSANGDSIWSKSLSYFPYIWASTLLPVGDNFIVCGAIDSLTNNGPGNMNASLFCFNEAGDSLWSKAYFQPGNQKFFDIHATLDGGYIATGIYNPDPQNFSTIFDGLYMVKFDANFDTVWTRYFPSVNGPVSGLSISQTKDTGYILCGSQSSDFQYSHYTMVLVKTDGLGYYYPEGIGEKTSSLNLQPFPNPSRGIFFLNPPGKFRELEVSGILGNVILHQAIDPNNNSTLKIDLSGNPEGVYLLRLKNRNSVMIGKIVLRH
ncbi:MAG: T9SS type A sorting domain-containing protein [Bacteroidetes bacterium]|nr:T9SS type A sorting domain-containing protein [Bacteroidota bacterium]